MKNFIFALIITSIISSSAYAVGKSTDVTVIRIGTGQFYTNTQCGGITCAVIAVSTPPTTATGTTPTTCSNLATGWHFVVNTSTPEGVQAYSALLAVYSSGSIVTIEGLGTCMSTSTVEELNYVILKK